MRAGYTVDDQATEAVQLVEASSLMAEGTKHHLALNPDVSGSYGLANWQIQR
jgi:hypothetical protein